MNTDILRIGFTSGVYSMKNINRQTQINNNIHGGSLLSDSMQWYKIGTVFTACNKIPVFQLKILYIVINALVTILPHNNNH